MTISLPSLSAGSSGGGNSIASINAAINQQKTNIENVINGLQGVDALTWNNSTATLASDTLSLTNKPRALVIDTEGGASTDNLSTISNGTAYQSIWIKAANAGRVITVKHNVGNIKLWGGNDVVLNSTNWLMLFYDGTQWSDMFIPPPVPIGTIWARAQLGSSAGSMSIPTIPATYKHLRLIIEARGDAAAVNESLKLQLNGDSTGANYYTQHQYAFGSTNTALERLGADAGALLALTGAAASAPANSFGICIVEILNYASTTAQKAMAYQGGVRGGTGTGTIGRTSGSGFWLSTAAIASLVLLPNSSSNFVAGSALTLYGFN